jgi:tRNA pseudouridine38-40 synthase
MRNLRIRLAYDGTGYSGWQVQPGQPTIQAAVESALGKIEGRPVKLHGSGRTDAGVHALGQVASFVLENPIPPENLKKALNRLLPRDIRVLECDEPPAGFHARHSALAKTYEYRIHRAEVCPPFVRRYVYHHPYPLDEAAMTEGAAAFEGEHDFRSFASAGGNEMESSLRTIYSSRLGREDDLLVYRVRGNGFLYHMVRNIVGTLLEIGRGNLAPGDMAGIIRAADRRAAGPMVPAAGLFLVSVEYGSVPLAGRPGRC